MIISRTPFRISFFGGGTDYPDWFKEHKGAVLATTIDKYCYISCRYLPPFFDYKSRIAYSKMELVNNINEIDHPAVRETLKFLKIKQGIEVHHDGDLPARTGLGTSSSFMVGLLNSLYALKGYMPTKEQLAKEAIFLEQEKCGDNVGCQDQTLVAYGGFSYIEFGGNNHLRVRKITIPSERLKDFRTHLMMFFTGFSRTASEVAVHQIKNIPKRTRELKKMYQMTDTAMNLLNDNELRKFGQLLHEGWLLKRSLSKSISTPAIDDIYDSARQAGAIGGKLLGAGGGGFILLFADPKKQPAIRKRLNKLLEIPIKFENLGTQIIFYQPNSGKVS